MKNEITLTQTEPLELVYNKSTKIRDLKEQKPILEMLNYLYSLLNISGDRIPNNLDESVIIGVILNNFKNFSTDEIKHAFRLCLDGTLNVQLYNKFDCIVLGKVLVAYKDYKQRTLKPFLQKALSKNNDYTKEDINKIELNFIDTCVKPYIKKRKLSNNLVITHENYIIFKHYYTKKILIICEKDKKKYNEMAKTMITNDLIAKTNNIIDNIYNHKNQKIYSGSIALHHNYKQIEQHLYG